MSKPVRISDERIAMAAEIACLMEVGAEKPGNVTPTRRFKDLGLEHFLLCSVAVGTVLRSDLDRPIGEIIYRMVQETRRLCGTNVNLGIILLFAPLAKIFRSHGNLTREISHEVLRRLTVDDAALVYRAIRLIRPSGMGKLNRHDFRKKPKITFLRAMELARERDTIASEYATGFSILRSISYPYFRKQIRSGLPVKPAIVQTFLYVLSEIPDTLIMRKTDRKTAEGVSREAAEVLNSGGVRTAEGTRRLDRFDRKLRSPSNALNPGTTADLVAGTLFIYFLKNGFGLFRSGFN